MGSASMWWWLASTSYELERPPRNVKYRARVKRNNLTTVRNNNNTVTGAGSRNSSVSGRTSSMIATVKSPGKVCRVCLKDGEVPIHRTGTDLCESVKVFGDIQIDKADKFPKYLCGMCHSMLQSAILFRKQAKETELILQGKNVSNKTESSDPVAKKSWLKVEGHLRGQSAPKSNNIPKGSAPVVECEEKIDSDILATKPSYKMESEFEVKKQCIVLPQSSPDRQEVHLEDTDGAKICTSDYTSQKSLVQLKKSTQNSSHCQIYKKTKSSSSIEQHSSESNICKICGKTFSTNYGLYKHVLLHSSKLGVWDCEFCPYRGNTVKNYKIHLLTHTKEKPYVCDECGLGYTTKSSLTVHQLRHMGKQFKCNICQKSYYTKRQLERHERCVLDWCHDGPDGFACVMCGKKYKNKLVLRMHERSVHKVKTSRSLQQHTSESKICDICGKTFSSKYSLAKHIMLHSSELPFHCEFCPYRGNTVDNYKIHLRSHAKVKPFICDGCGLGCTTKSNLIKHQLRRHKEKQFKCTKCQKRYYTKRELERHVRCVVHRRTDSPQVVECGMCANKFESKKVLRTHERSVHKDKQQRIGRKPLYLENVSKPQPGTKEAAS